MTTMLLLAVWEIALFLFLVLLVGEFLAANRMVLATIVMMITVLPISVKPRNKTKAAVREITGSVSV